MLFTTLPWPSLLGLKTSSVSIIYILWCIWGWARRIRWFRKYRRHFFRARTWKHGVIIPTVHWVQQILRKLSKIDRLSIAHHVSLPTLQECMESIGFPTSTVLIEQCNAVGVSLEIRRIIFNGLDHRMMRPGHLIVENIFSFATFSPEGAFSWSGPYPKWEQTHSAYLTWKSCWPSCPLTVSRNVSVSL